MAVPPPLFPAPAMAAMAAEPSKPAQRAELRARRDAFVLDLEPGERALLEARAAARLMPLMEGAGCIAFYQAIGSEMGCGAAIDLAANAGMAIALPHVAGRDRPMRFLRWRPGDPLERGWRGLIQPLAASAEIRPDMVVTPLLGFDSARRRLGQGAGFYDRAFATIGGGVKKIGWGWSVQQLGRIACDPWDVPLDAVVTETTLIGG